MRSATAASFSSACGTYASFGCVTSSFLCLASDASCDGRCGCAFDHACHSSRLSFDAIDAEMSRTLAASSNSSTEWFMSAPFVGLVSGISIVQRLGAGSNTGAAHA